MSDVLTMIPGGKPVSASPLAGHRGVLDILDSLAKQASIIRGLECAFDEPLKDTGVHGLTWVLQDHAKRLDEIAQEIRAIDGGAA